MSPRRSGFSLLEIAVSLIIVIALLAVLLPALASARTAGHREQCANALRHFGTVWHAYLEDHDGRFPRLAVLPGWHYAGARFSAVDGHAFPDGTRPLNAYLGDPRSLRDPRTGGITQLCRCPADRGITDADGGVGTGSRTAFRSYGISYRANASLLSGEPGGGPAGAAGLHRERLLTVPSRLMLMGDPVWFEVRADTGRDADWHGEPHAGNLLFLDGRVQFVHVDPPSTFGPVVYEPRLK